VRRLVPPLLLALVQGAALFGISWDKSDTVDEPFYLENALNQWAKGDLEGNCDSPALPKWGFGLALRVSDPELVEHGDTLGHQPIFSRPFPQGRRNLLAARSTTILVTVLGGLGLFGAALRMGYGPAVLTHALYVVSPAILAHGSLATLDAWATAFAALGILAGLRALESPRWSRLALFGAVVALGSACKVPLLGLLPVFWGALLVLKGRKGLLASCLLTLLPFLVVLSGVYLFRFGEVSTTNLCGHVTHLYGDHEFGPLPFAPWIEGILFQGVHGATGHLTYLFGASSEKGWWYFYLAALLFKTTLGAQVLFLLAAIALARVGTPQERLAGALLLAYPLLLLGVMSLGHAQNGLKYVLPAYPFGILFLSSSLPLAERSWGRRGRGIVLLAALLSVVESARVYPHELMFFNAWAGGPEGGPRILIHGDDWGQDQRRLGAWQEAHHPWRLYYTRYNGDPLFWGIRGEEPPCEPAPGYYALHAVEIFRPKRLPRGCLDWLTVEPPDLRLGYSIYLYQVNKERIARLEAERGEGHPFWRTGSEPPSPRESR
jgi:hypothetical protein